LERGTGYDGNYLTGDSRTAVQIAQSYHGNNYNLPIYTVNVGAILHHNYSVYYYYYGLSAPSETLVVTNLQQDFPVYSKWGWTNGNKIGDHIGVIRGINQSANSIFVMDPEFGFAIASKSSGLYTYVSAYSGVTLTLNGYCAMISA